MTKMIETITAVQATGTVGADVAGATNHGVTGCANGAASLLSVAAIPSGLPRGSGASGPPRRARRRPHLADAAPRALRSAPDRSPLDRSPLVITQALETAEAVTRGWSGWVAPARPARGVTVCGPDGSFIGVLTAISSPGALVERPQRPAVYVPFEAIATVRDEQLTLTMAADQVDRMPWQRADDGIIPGASDRLMANAPGGCAWR